MNRQILDRQFARIGARLKVAEIPRPRRFGLARPFSLDIRSDRQGEVFEIDVSPRAEVAIEVLDVRPDDRHLLLLARQNGEKQKFLCGHDERHWFVAAIPESAPVGTVRQAKEALKPVEVLRVQAAARLNAKARGRRKNAAYIRQGEWFFVPARGLNVAAKFVITNEPLVRTGGGKPHWAEFCCRLGGQTVYVCGQYPSGLTSVAYHQVRSQNPDSRHWHRRVMARNPTVYVRGRIRHADHRTVVLREWHRVFMSTENQSAAMRNVAFLD